MLLLKMSKAAKTMGSGAETRLQLGCTCSQQLGTLAERRVWLARVYWFSLFTSFVNMGENCHPKHICRLFIQIFHPSCSFLSSPLTAPPLCYCRFYTNLVYTDHIVFAAHINGYICVSLL